jgi:fructan beta-fructosidase
MERKVIVLLVKNGLVLAITVLFLFACSDNKSDQSEGSVALALNLADKHRPQFHFSPDSMWMNDPNGLVYYADTYHLFYQYYPDSTVWGPMHWGHATSSNMISWEDQPIALYPDQLGYIFSGSAIFDQKNTSGFGSVNNPPLIAIFTYHDPVAAKQNPAMSQSQGIAYSLDSGRSWQKYENNPVLKSPGINDFRDPKVRWYEDEQKWIMTLAVKDHIRFYSSVDLKNWTLESEFGKEIGAHGGVWECPDLFPLSVEESGDTYWILIVSINPGGPNGGSATQYFVGQFDGTTFMPKDEKIRWIDYGPDNYAGVTWSNTGDRTLFIGWMSNWKYAQVVPTQKWRSAMTIPRELYLDVVDNDIVVSSIPVPEFDELDMKSYQIPEFEINGDFSLSDEIQFRNATYEMDMNLLATDDIEIKLYNDAGNYLVINYDIASNAFVIDRSKTGDTSFHPGFGNLVNVPRVSESDTIELKLVVDVASMELFADDGSAVSTTIFFPEEVLDRISFHTQVPVKAYDLILKDIL